MTEVSVVIPTKDRKEDLLRLLSCLEKQTVQPLEVIVVDSSTQSLVLDELPEMKGLQIIKSQPSVCIQRNIGIEAAKGSYILLCDDDVSFEENYIEQLLAHKKKLKNVVAVSGLWYQQDGSSSWEYSYPPKNFLELLSCWFFKLSLWGPVDQVQIAGWLKPIFGRIKKAYQAKPNFVTTAGWPVYHHFDGEVISTPVTSLGSALIDARDLKANKYDEVLDPYGYGDNYDVCARLTKAGGQIHVLKTLTVKHHQSTQNRASLLIAQYRRTLALAYFVKVYKHFDTSFASFIWSLMGLVLTSVFSFNLSNARIYLKALFLIAINQNPYVEGKKKSKKVVIP